jgi:hypothetical protein
MRVLLFAFMLASGPAGSALFAQTVISSHGTSDVACVGYPPVAMEEIDDWAATQQGPPGGEPLSSSAVAKVPHRLRRPDFNREIYYRNKL